MRFSNLLQQGGDESFVAGASVGGAGLAAQGEHDGCEDVRLPAGEDDKGLLHQPLINKTNFPLGRPHSHHVRPG